MAASTPHNQFGVSLLETKLYAPRWRPELVSRPRLLQSLEEGYRRMVTLISAPAGSGKTTLLAEWLSVASNRTHRAGWVSLGTADNDTSIFWAYVIRALQHIHPEAGRQTSSMLFTAQPPPMQGLLTTLINEISQIEERFTVVLDDYHVITESAIHEGIAFLIDHLPPSMHLVIASRTDPPFPLPRLRARRDLMEIRATDLRFTPHEASAFLNEVMGLNLSGEDIQALESRTEGWIAGLQLAALSMQGRDDTKGFITSFSGDDRYIVDYLIEEVLLRQSGEVRRFLLQTSILDRLNGSLCDAVADTATGHQLLQQLERANLFVVPLDDKRHWYRYHHLFGDMLQAHLGVESPDQVATLHRRASLWYESQGYPVDAINHALAAGDFERTANLIEASWYLMNKTYQTARVLAWLQQVPEDLIRSRPMLCIGYGWGFLEQGDMDHGHEWLNLGEALLQNVEQENKAFRYMSYHLASARTYRALALGDIPATLSYADHALDIYPEGDYSERSVPMALTGIAHWSTGNLEAASEAFSRVKGMYEEAGDVLLTISGSFVLAEVSLCQGKLQAALKEYLEAITLLESKGNAVKTGLTDLYAGAGKVYLYLGDTEKAGVHLATSVKLGEVASLPGNMYQRYGALGQLKEAEGFLEEALQMFDLAQQTFVLSPMPLLRPFAAQRVRVLIKLGRLDEALEWAADKQVAAPGGIFYMEEFNQLTLARIFIAQYQRTLDPGILDRATSLLSSLLTTAEKERRTGSIIEILILQALALQAGNDIPAALAALEYALTLGEPEHHVYVFTVEGEPMLQLLRHSAAGGIGGAYTRTLIHHVNEPTAAPSAQGTLVNPLTSREIEILRLIAAGMRNQEIADHLFISLATVKRHIANVYGKLDVTHRTEAIVKGQELGIL